MQLDRIDVGGLTLACRKAGKPSDPVPTGTITEDQPKPAPSLQDLLRDYEKKNPDWREPWRSNPPRVLYMDDRDLQQPVIGPAGADWREPSGDKFC